MEADFPYNDALLEANREELKIKDPRNLVCNSKNKIVKMCVNSSCEKTSLICGIEECESCEQKQHIQCQQISLKGVTSFLNEHNEKKNQILKKIGELENIFFNSFLQTTQELKQKLRFAGQGEKQKKIVEEIYEKNNAKCLKGKEASQFKNKIKESAKSQSCIKEIENIFKEYERYLKQVAEKVHKIKDRFCEVFNSKTVSKVVFDSNILSLKSQHAEVLNNILKQEKIKKAERLFRASQHGFSAKTFHQKCDNQEDTLVLIRTQFGKIIGGYTHYPWTSPPDSWEPINDSGRRAFLFSLDMREKFVPQGDDHLIKNRSGYGPVFGCADIGIYDGCNSNSRSFANFPYTYNRAGGNKLEDNKDTWRMFSGGDTSFFRVQQYEVFRVWYS